MVDPATLRLVWGVVEEARPAELLTVGDRELVEQLVSRLLRKKILTGEEHSRLITYLYSKLSLIRDLAEVRTA